MKIKVKYGRFSFTLFAGMRFAFFIAKKAARKNPTAKKILSVCSKEIIRECKRYKRKNGSLVLIEAENNEGKVLIKL